MYYIPRSRVKRNPGGKIYNKIVNTKQKRAKREKLEKEIDYKRNKPNSTGSDVEGDAAYNWLVLNTHPWGTTIDKWAASFNRRRHELQNPFFIDKVLGFYRHYKDPYGYQLVSSPQFRVILQKNHSVLKTMAPKLICQNAFYKITSSSKIVLFS